MSAQQHALVSAGRRRRRRLRRSLVVAAALIVTLTWAVAYAVSSRGGGPASEREGGSHEPKRSVAAAAPVPRSRTGPSTPAPAPASTDPAGSGQGADGDLAPVVTDRIPDPTTSIPISGAVPGTTNMQVAAAGAFERAFADARRAGERPGIKSAWRSAEWQQVLFDRAITRYGSSEAASRWVLRPEQSAHVKGYAVDVEPRSAAAWLEVHGPAYGVCRTYDNEWWHFEYLATHDCPPRQPSAAG